MSRDLKKLDPSVQLRRALPLGYGEIMVHEAVLDARTEAERTLHLRKYQHAQLFTPRSTKPISKLDL